MRKIVTVVSCFLFTAAYLATPARAACLTPKLYSCTPACQLIFLPPDNLNLIIYITLLPILFLIGFVLGLIKNPSTKKQEKKNAKKETAPEKPASPNSTSSAPYGNTSASHNNASSPYSNASSPYSNTSVPGNVPRQQYPGNSYRKYW